MSLGPGSLIEPGNWGRILNSYRAEPAAAQNAWMLARELAFETVRAGSHKGLPSRLSCAFVFETMESATQHRNVFAQWSAIYEVELVTPEAPSHRAAYNFVTMPINAVEFLPLVMQRAIPYWLGQGIEVPELLTKSSLRVVQRVMGHPGAYQP